MPGSTQIARGNIAMEMLIQASLTPTASISANTSVVATYTIQGLVVGDFIESNQQSHVAGLSVGNMWVSSTNTLSVQWVNSTTSTSSGSPTAATFVLCVARPDNVAFGIANLPTGIY